jgi:hypothetical protein
MFFGFQPQTLLLLFVMQSLLFGLFFQSDPFSFLFSFVSQSLFLLMPNAVSFSLGSFFS